MGSKAAMLRGDLGTVLLREASSSSRFVDLFAGSASVSHFVAERVPVPVLSVDLQAYSSIFASSILSRTEPMEGGPLLTDWTKSVEAEIASDPAYARLAINTERLGKATVGRARRLSKNHPSDNFIVRHYGGHYFSPQQALVLDDLFKSLPESGAERTVGLAALLRTASRTAAAPGHTAQPFQPTDKLIPYIRQAWSRDILVEAQRQVELIAARSARVLGASLVASAEEVIPLLGEGDLVFCDPPYSAAQYSRFYHVLEGISRGGWPDVAGAGRAPAREARATSAFSMVSTATTAMRDLLTALRERSCVVAITFPDADASNGLSATKIIDLARPAWRSESQLIESTHSTMGGSSVQGRGGRKKLHEAVIILRPK